MPVVRVVDGSGEPVLVDFPIAAPVPAFRNAGGKTSKHVAGVAHQPQYGRADTLMGSIAHAEGIPVTGGAIVPIAHRIAGVRITEGAPLGPIQSPHHTLI